MSLRLIVNKRNFELENIKHIVKPKRITAREDPLSHFKRENAEARLQAQSHALDEKIDPKKENEAPEFSKLGDHDPLADFKILEATMVARNEFESWESKKLKIFQQFKIITDHREIVIDERRDRDTDRILKMGVGKSRLDQL